MSSNCIKHTKHYNRDQIKIDYSSAETIQAVKLITSFTLMDPIELFENQILTRKQSKLIKKRW
jgi:hypothetical protein